jgi:hypothetical protein
MWCASAGVRPQTTWRGDESAMLLLAQTNGLGRNATVPNDCCFRSRRLGTVESLVLLPRAFGARVADNLRYSRPDCPLSIYSVEKLGFSSRSQLSRPCSRYEKFLLGTSAYNSGRDPAMLDLGSLMAEKGRVSYAEEAGGLRP